MTLARLRRHASASCLWDIDHTLIKNHGVNKKTYALAFELLTGQHPEHAARTLVIQGYTVTDPQGLADVGPVPEVETLVEIPRELLRFAHSPMERNQGTGDSGERH
jgi:hypothetical protein